MWYIDENTWIGTDWSAQRVFYSRTQYPAQRSQPKSDTAGARTFRYYRLGTCAFRLLCSELRDQPISCGLYIQHQGTYSTSTLLMILKFLGHRTHSEAALQIGIVSSARTLHATQLRSSHSSCSVTSCLVSIHNQSWQQQNMGRRSITVMRRSKLFYTFPYNLREPLNRMKSKTSMEKHCSSFTEILRTQRIVFHATQDPAMQITCVRLTKPCPSLVHSPMCVDIRCSLGRIPRREVYQHGQLCFIGQSKVIHDHRLGLIGRYPSPECCEGTGNLGVTGEGPALVWP